MPDQSDLTDTRNENLCHETPNAITLQGQHNPNHTTSKRGANVTNRQVTKAQLTLGQGDLCKGK